MGYLTPNEVPDGYTCRALFIPDSEPFLAIMRGAIQELTFAGNWSKFGDLSTIECAELFLETFDRFCFNQGRCLMIGELIAYAGATSPDDRLLMCDGSQVAIEDYPDLYAVIGDTYGLPDVGNFVLPDMRGRAPAGIGTGAGLSGVLLGQQYGEENHVLTVGELPAHNHAYDPVIVGDLDVEGAGVPQPNAAQIVPAITENTYDTGGNGGHNTIGPRLGVNYLIVAKD